MGRNVAGFKRALRLLVGVGVVGVTALQVAPASSAKHVEIQALMNPDGSGQLSIIGPPGPWRWEACSPDLKSCSHFGGGREIATRGAPAGTVFRVKGNGAVGVSPEWRGPVRQLEASTVLGLVRANEFVSPIPGIWSGGWKGEFSAMQLSACTTAAGEGCTTLTDPHFVRNCAASSSFVLDARFAGSYLRVADKRSGVGPSPELPFAVTSPFGGEVWAARRITSVAIVGHIAPAIAAFPGECGPPAPAKGFISKRGVAFITCPAGCRAELQGTGNGRSAHVVRQLPEQNALFVAPATEIRLPMRVVGENPARLVVRIDGRQVARRTVRLGN